MRITVNILRIIVGLLFVLNAFVKITDPLGFSYQLEEYLGPAVFDFPALAEKASAFSAVIAVVQLIAGLMLLLGYALFFTRWLLLIIGLFFTFPTFYLAYFNITTDYSWLGDMIQLSPWQSFAGNSVLLLLLILLFCKSHLIIPLFKIMTSKWIIFTGFVFSLFLIYHGLTCLPTVDYSPYKTGSSVPEVMIPVKDTLMVGDQENPELQTPEEEEEKALWIISYRLEKSNPEDWESVKEAAQKALKHGYSVSGFTASSKSRIEEIRTEYELSFDFVPVDEVTAKTLIRANPGLLLVSNGIIIQKVSGSNAKKLKLN